VIMRARLWTDQPLDPPLSAFAGAPGRRIVARTAHWQVETACR
jgi:hypothetical protein